MYSQENLVSIITPSYNSEEFISETINSIINQTYSNWELLITDDFSTDNTIEIVESYVKNDSRIKLFKLEKNSGAAIARNNSISNSKGRYIAFLDSDDLWLKKKLELQIEFMRKGDYALTYTSYEKFKNRDTFISNIYSLNKLSYNNMLRNNYIGCLTAIYDSKKLGKILMPNIRRRQDYALWLKILKQIDYAYGLDIVLSKYRVLETSLSKGLVTNLKYTFYMFRDVEKFSFVKAFFSTIKYLIFYLKKNK
jgi:glycosyltransferase involved in cell wall biosynthesis|tara:strand:- start:2134 stop:2889 length:756 start_codon:yes stop_codon:yes gene_type:complete